MDCNVRMFHLTNQSSILQHTTGLRTLCTPITGYAQFFASPSCIELEEILLLECLIAHQDFSYTRESIKPFKSHGSSPAAISVIVRQILDVVLVLVQQGASADLHYQLQASDVNFMSNLH